MGADAMREAYAVPVARAVHFWTDIGRLRDSTQRLHQCSLEQTAYCCRWYDRADAERRPQKMTTENQAQWWIGFTCKQCHAPLAVQRSNDASKSAKPAARGWRVTCTSCGVTEYYEPGTPMLSIAVSN